MEWGLFIKGFIIGFSIAAPVGPIGILCIQRTLLSGATGIFRHKISEGKLALVNKISGIVILVFGIGALISAVV